MPVTSVHNNAAESRTIYQDNEEGIAEQAIMLERTIGGVAISQNGNQVYIDETCVKEVCRQMNLIAKIEVK
jgi:hypothetical protein